MKFAGSVLALALLSSILSILVAAQCEACEALSTMECSQALADKYNECLISSCDNKPTVNPLDNCTGGPSDESPITDSGPGPTSTGSLSSTSAANYSTPASTHTASTGPKTTASTAAAPAFSGIGVGGGAAAMVGLAGLVGLIL